MNQPSAGCGRWTLRHEGLEEATDFRFERGRQRVEHGQMSGQKIAIRRKMSLALLVEPGVICGAQLRGND
jgi:hypothetical protein